MPITPFHFGLGMLVKPALRSRFSLWTFILSQILVDLETLWNIIRQVPRLHGFFHSFLGSLIPGMAAAFILRAIHPSSSLPTLLFSSLIGVWSHVVLDGIMHADVTPFFPFSTANPLLHLCSLTTLHLGLVVSGVAGSVWWLMENRKKKVGGQVLHGNIRRHEPVVR
jgi:membrane-bound metal-dependent hydrolase YbcI (DUF457 family)